VRGFDEQARFDKNRLDNNLCFGGMMRSYYPANSWEMTVEQLGKVN